MFIKLLCHDKSRRQKESKEYAGIITITNSLNLKPRNTLETKSMFLEKTILVTLQTRKSIFKAFGEFKHAILIHARNLPILFACPSGPTPCCRSLRSERKEELSENKA